MLISFIAHYADCQAAGSNNGEIAALFQQEWRSHLERPSDAMRHSLEAVRRIPVELQLANPVGTIGKIIHRQTLLGTVKGSSRWSSELIRRVGATNPLAHP